MPARRSADPCVWLAYRKNGGTGLSSTRLWERLEYVVGIGAVGLLKRDPHPGQLYAHGSGSSSALLKELREASVLAGERPPLQAEIRPTGVPPSSVHSFLRANRSLAVAVLTEYESTFKNRYYGSGLDDGGNYDVAAVTEAAARIARYLRMLTHPKTSGAELQELVVNATIVEGAMSFLVPRPGGRRLTQY